MFATESLMQSWMKDAINNEGSLRRIILPIDYPLTCSAKESAILKSYQDAINALIDPIIIIENQNVSHKKGCVLRPDFILMSRESGCFFVVELKNNIAATRQTGTEVGAYSASIQETYPGMAGGNIITVIVSTEWPALLLSSALHEIVYEMSCCLLLRPVIVDGEIKLSTIPPADLILQQSHLDRAKSISGCHLDATPKWRYNPCLKKEIKYIDRYRNMMHSVQMEGRKQKSHGFAFLWHRGDETEGATVSYAILSQRWTKEIKYENLCYQQFIPKKLFL